MIAQIPVQIDRKGLPGARPDPLRLAHGHGALHFHGLRVAQLLQHALNQWNLPWLRQQIEVAPKPALGNGVDGLRQQRALQHENGCTTYRQALTEPGRPLWSAAAWLVSAARPTAGQVPPSGGAYSPAPAGDRRQARAGAAPARPVWRRRPFPGYSSGQIRIRLCIDSKAGQQLGIDGEGAPNDDAGIKLVQRPGARSLAQPGPQVGLIL